MKLSWVIGMVYLASIYVASASKEAVNLFTHDGNTTENTQRNISLTSTSKPDLIQNITDTTPKLTCGLTQLFSTYNDVYYDSRIDSGIKLLSQLYYGVLTKNGQDTMSIDDYTGKPTPENEYPYDFEKRNVTVAGLNSVKDVTSFSLSNSTFESSLQIGRLVTTGWYRADYTSSIGIFSKHGYGSGRSFKEIENLNASIKLEFGTRPNTQVVFVKKCSLTIPLALEVNSTMDNFMENGQLVDWTLRNERMNSWWKTFSGRPFLKRLLEAICTEKISQVLLGCTWVDLWKVMTLDNATGKIHSANLI